MKYILYDVLLPLGGKAIFTYKSLCSIGVGSLVRVSILRSYVFGVVLSVNLNEEKDIHFTVKEIESVIYTWKFSAILIDFMYWVADYYLIPLGVVFSLYFIPKKLAESYMYVFSTEIDIYNDIGENNKVLRTLTKRLLFLESLFKECGQLPDFILIPSGVKNVNELLRYKENGYIKCISRTPIFGETFQINSNISLSKEQAQVAKNILSKSNSFQSIFIDGVTGSGKTILYIRICLDLLNHTSKQILILVPEINLVNTVIRKLKDGIGILDLCAEKKNVYNNLIHEWHSNLSTKNRDKVWYSVAKNYTRIIVGPRSALFLPYVNLSLIVVDEEHDCSYKQALSQSKYAYNTRDMAIVLAKKLDIPIILTSATPSIETMYNAKIGKYISYYLMTRWNNINLPIVDIVDMKGSLNVNQCISRQVIQALENNINKGEQSMVFINKRGFAKVMLCTKCGYKFVCEFCSTYLVLYKRAKQLLCHCCGYSTDVPTECAECKDRQSIKLYGFGIEQVTYEVSKIFPDAKIASISSDEVYVPDRQVGKFEQMDDYIEKIKSNQSDIDIIICTQILSKGHTFPNLTLVCIIDADNNAHYSDLRYVEKSFQILTQVIGRAGRRKGKIGYAIVQTFKPNEPIIYALKNNDREALYAKEFDHRQQIDFPPFSKMAIILFKHKEQIKTLNAALELAFILKEDKNIVVFGPTPSIIEKVRGLYRFKILVKSKKNYSLQSSIKNAIDIVNNVNKNYVTISVDIDPIDLL